MSVDIDLCRKHRLSNGLEILTIPTRQAPVVALQGWIRFGSADETQDIAGLAHLFEHLLFKGTERRAVGQIAREIEGLGGDLNAYTSYDQTVMHMTLASKDFDSGLDILADSLQNSVVDADELVREREVVLEEIRRRNDMPGAIAMDLVRNELFKNHTYARPVIGYAEVVEKMSRETILEQYRKYYNASNLFLVVAGDINDDHVLASCEKAFRKLKPGYVTPERKDPAPVKSTVSTFQHHPSPDSILQIAWQGPRASDTEAAALDAFALILGQGESSRLVRKLVHDDKLLREIGSGCWTPKNHGSFGVYFKGAKGMTNDFDRILGGIRECIDRPITEAELSKAKKNLLSSATYSKETVDGLAQRFGSCEALANDWRLDGRYLDAVHRLSAHDLEKARDHFLDWNHAVGGGIVTAGDALPEMKTPKKAVAKKETPKSPSETIEAFEFRGLRVLLKQQEHLPIFSLRLTGFGGSRLEPAAKSGVGALWSRCVSEGATAPDGKRFTREEINELVDRASAGFGAFHGRNSWGFQLDGLSEDFEMLTQLMSASLLHPAYDPKIFTQEKKHLLEDLKSATDNPSSVAGVLFSAAMYPGHAYGRRASGSPESVKKITLKDVIAYHKKCLGQPLVLSIVGDISRSRLEEVLAKNFSEVRFAKKSPLQKKIKVAPLKKDIVQRAKLKKEQTHIFYGFRSCTLFDADRWPLMAMSAVLSGQGGRLFLELRDKLSLCYTVSPTHVEGIDAGYFGFYIATAPDKEATALEALKIQVQRIVKEGVSKDELAHAISFYCGNHEIEQQKLSGQAMGLALDELYGLGWQDYAKFSSYLQAVTPADVHRVAKKYFAGKKTVTSIVGPLG